MQARPRPRFAPFLAVVGALAGACGSGSGGNRDGGTDTREPPDGPSQDARQALLTLDFTAIGCPELDLIKPQCRGPAPLTLTFVPITSGNITRFLWHFGDQARSSERLPSHTYTLPGTYEVTVIGSPGGAQQSHPAFVVVTPNRLGETCDVESQCAAGLSCVCGSAAKCPAAFARGICTSDCTIGCPEGAVCAQLPMSAPASTPEPWRRPLCLRACQRDSDCAVGHRCRAVPVAGTSDRWARACFVSFPGDLGEPCRGGNGELQGDLCMSGLCTDLGALGICSLDCRMRGCPDGTVCATFQDSRRRCIRPCGADFACREDPLLTCTTAGRPGPLGFTVAGAAPGATFCAPKPCDSDAQCVPAGTCVVEGEGRHCVWRPSRP